VHVPAPPTEYAPAVHGTQLADVNDPVAATYSPAEQAAQAEEAATEAY
jgi:hypothetical protein